VTGPLEGVRVVEFAGIGPGPLAGMLLSDWGADVVVIERPVEGAIRRMMPPQLRFADRGKRRTVLDLKSDGGKAAALALADRAQVITEGLRPGAMERLGLGPEVLCARNPALIYARITGWGQTGPRAQTAGHDITYVALSGALHGIGRADGPPVPPVNLLGDYAGGTMFAVSGILAALLAAERTGRGQVVDVAMVDGVLALQAPTLSLLAAGQWRDERGVNLLDTGAPFYEVYRTRDGRWVAVGALEDQFFAVLVEGLGLDRRWLVEREDVGQWPRLRSELEAAIGRLTRDQLDARFRATDGCIAPVLALGELAEEPHHRERRGVVTVGGHVQPASAPRFSETPAREPSAPDERILEVAEILESWREPQR